MTPYIHVTDSNGTRWAIDHASKRAQPYSYFAGDWLAWRSIDWCPEEVRRAARVSA